MSNFYQFFFINSSFFFFLSCSFFVFVYAWVCVCVGGAGIFWSLCQSCLELIILSPCWVWVCVGNSDPESWGRVSSTHTHSLLTSPSILPVNSSCLHAQADAGSHFLEYILEYNTVFLFFFCWTFIWPGGSVQNKFSFTMMTWQFAADRVSCVFMTAWTSYLYNHFTNLHQL